MFAKLLPLCLLAAACLSVVGAGTSVQASVQFAVFVGSLTTFVE